MREILFRGKDAVTGQWFYGDLLRKDISCYIVYPVETWEDDYSVENSAGAPGRKKKILYVEKRVMEETVGQYTGVNDKNGGKVFEGDRVRRRVWFAEEGKNYIDYILDVKWNGWNYCLFIADKQMWGLHPSDAAECEVIGNIHDK